MTGEQLLLCKMRLYIQPLRLWIQPLLQTLQEEESAASLAPVQPDAQITEQAVAAMPAWHAYRAGLKQKGYFKVAPRFV